MHFYTKPFALSLDEWENWHNETKAKYPIQYFFRETVSFFFYCKYQRLERAWYKVKHFFSPKHQDIRRAIPREWADISSLIVDVNFAMILDFKKEVDQDTVNWASDDEHKKFIRWFSSAVNYINVERKKLLENLDKSYPPFPLPKEMSKLSYDELYGEVNRIDKEIDDKDTAILKQMIDYRHFFWT